MEKELTKTAQNILLNYLKAKKEEKILILSEGENSIENAFKEACELNELNYEIFVLNTPRSNSSPIPEALDAMKKANIIISPTKNSTTHCDQTTEVVKMGKKVVTLPGITEEIFLKIKEADFEEIFKLNNKIEEYMKDKDYVHITTPSGTDITLRVKNRKWIGNEDMSKGFVNNLPEGETFCAPIETSANGIIRIDHWKDLITPEMDAIIEVQFGKIVSWNDAAKKFIDMHSVPNGLIIAELGIGTNKAHKKPIGNILHDEKIYGTCHIAFGQNTSFGGVNSSPVHSDIILLNPTIIVDGEKFEI